MNQNMWVPQKKKKLCLDLFPVFVFITQFSHFWVISYGNWKHIWGVFSFQNSVSNSIFVIKPTYPAAMFDKWTNFLFYFFFVCETQPQLLKLKNGWWVKVPNGGFGKLWYFKWRVMSNKWQKLGEEWWVMTKKKNQTTP